MTYGKVTLEIVRKLQDILGPENVLTKPHERLQRTMSAAPFPLHKWGELMPDVAVLPGSAEEVVSIVKLANVAKIPIVPRGGGTGLADGAVPLRKGIVVDMKRMNKILEIDEKNLCATVQPGINLWALNEELGKRGFLFPDDPASYPGAVVGGRIGTNGFSPFLVGCFGNTQDLVISLELVLPTGRKIRVGQGGGKKTRKSSYGYNLKNLFFGHQGTLGIVTEATLEMVPKPEVELPVYYGFSSFEDAYDSLGRIQRSGVSCCASLGIIDYERITNLRRDDEAFIMLPEDIRSMIWMIFYGNNGEVHASKDTLSKICDEGGGVLLGKQFSAGWAARHDGYAIPLHGRTIDGKSTPLKWHCEDAAILYSEIPEVRRKWHEIGKKYREYGFEDWGSWFFNNNPFKLGGDYLSEVDIGIDEIKFDDELWKHWVNLKREIAEVTLAHGGSISACHGGTRPGDVELLPKEMSDGFWLMKEIKKMLDPNNIMNPGKYLLDEAYQ